MLSISSVGISVMVSFTAGARVDHISTVISAMIVSRFRRSPPVVFVVTAL